MRTQHEMQCSSMPVLVLHGFVYYTGSLLSLHQAYGAPPAGHYAGQEPTWWPMPSWPT